MSKERYCTGEGPECPKCCLCFTADDPIYYDERGFDTTCICGTKFHVQPCITTTWTTKAIPVDAAQPIKTDL